MELRQVRVLCAGSTRVVAVVAAMVAITRGDAGAQTFQEALGGAYRDNPTLQAARAELRRADEQVPQARAGWRPQADLTTGGGAAASQGASQRSNLSAP